MHSSHHAVVKHAYDFWLARAAVAAIAILQLLLRNDFSIGTRWLAPSVELALLAPLSVATAWAQAKAARATSEHHFSVVGRLRRTIRRTAVGLTALITAVKLFALLLLLRGLVFGHAGDAKLLLVDAVNIWCTNVIAFSLWYWSIDRGGPAARGISSRSEPDFLFPQNQIADLRFSEWSPGFIDYLFLAFTNATAFSPTDVLPLSSRAKLLMMANAMISLLTLAIVAARAVNILS